MRAKIGVLPLYDSEKDSLWMVPGYMNGIIKAGGVPYILPLTTDNNILKEVCDEMDGFLFTGGQDVNPLLYTDKIQYYCNEICFERDEEEKFLIERLINMDKPLLGICRGIQILNVVMGGTLYQDIPTERGHKITLNHKQGHPYSEGTHKVEIFKDTMLYECIQKETLLVNSLHHQGIRKKAPNVKINAMATDGLIEGIEIEKTKMAMAVQWHPEFLYKNDESSQKLFNLLVRKSSF